MKDILSIIKSKNPEDITDRELSTFYELIEETIRKVHKLQAVHRSLTGKDYVPPIRLR
ncbi:MAG: hypothetical protein Q7J85_12355 [Bacillota bacterium]|nr:hypothetical protein [Bacillota bacterium]